jgi:hypothetical protein
VAHLALAVVVGHRACSRAETGAAATGVAVSAAVGCRALSSAIKVPGIPARGGCEAQTANAGARADDNGPHGVETAANAIAGTDDAGAIGMGAATDTAVGTAGAFGTEVAEQASVGQRGRPKPLLQPPPSLSGYPFPRNLHPFCTAAPSTFGAAMRCGAWACSRAASSPLQRLPVPVAAAL